MKDPEGRYFHRACRDRARRSAGAVPQQREDGADSAHGQRVEIPAARRRAKAAPARTDRDRAPEEASTPEEDAWTDDVGPSRLGEFLGGGDHSAGAPSSGQFAGRNGASAGGMCPQCGAAAPRGAVLCTVCGFHFKKGTAVRTKVGGGGGSSSTHSSGRKAAAGGVAAWPVAMSLGAVCGVVGGAIGALAWGYLAHQTGREFGFMAIGVGAMCGVGTRFGARSRKGLASGLIAVVIAILSIAGGKVTFLALDLGEALTPTASVAGGSSMGDQQAVLALVDREALRRERAGEALQWPPGMSYERAFSLGDFPPALAASVQQEWESLSEEARTERKAGIIRDWGVVALARQIAQQRAASGDTLNWSPGMSLEYAALPEDFPVRVRTDAEQRYDAMSSEQQAELVRPLLADDQLLRTLEEAAEVMASSYSGRSLVVDLVWGVLAISAAFTLGAGVGRT